VEQYFNQLHAAESILRS